MRGFTHLLLILLLAALLLAALLPFAGGTLLPAAARAQAGQWYMAKVEHSHAEHAAHTPAGPRVWERERQIDPRAMLGSQELYEVTQFPFGEQATPAQRREAEEFVRKCRESAQRHGWFEYERAAKDGFTLMFADLVHYVNMEHALDDRQLDPDRPEFLFFADTPSGKRLAAFMFLARGPDDRGRQIGGPLTLWHFHAWSKPVCLRDRRVVVGDLDASGRCADGVPSLRSPEMLHVWLVDRPEGPFATDMSITEDMQKALAKPARP